MTEESAAQEAESSGRPVADVAALARRVRTLMRLHRALECVDTGLTAPQYRILSLVRAGGERSARLAEKLAIAKPTLTAVADGLVAAGYVAREAEPGDRRVVRLYLTPAGREALERADAAYAAWLDPLLSGTHDPEQTLHLIDELEDAISSSRAKADPPCKRKAATAATGGEI